MFAPINVCNISVAHYCNTRTHHTSIKLHQSLSKVLLLLLISIVVSCHIPLPPVILRHLRYLGWGLVSVARHEQHGLSHSCFQQWCCLYSTLPSIWASILYISLISTSTNTFRLHPLQQRWPNKATTTTTARGPVVAVITTSIPNLTFRFLVFAPMPMHPPLSEKANWSHVSNIY